MKLKIEINLDRLPKDIVARNKEAARMLREFVSVVYQNLLDAGEATGEGDQNGKISEMRITKR